MAAKRATTKTKAIAQSVTAGQVSGNEGTQMSVVGRENLNRSLTPKQAYELVSTFRKAVDAKSADVAKARVRTFSRRSNAEIVSGSLYNLFRRPNRYTSTGRLLFDLTTWRSLTGESALFPNSTFEPTTLTVFDPSQLTAFPYQCVELEDVTTWKYHLGQGIWLDVPAEQMVFARNFNPNNRVRGLASVLATVNEASTNHYANRFNSSFFKNGATGNLIIRFPKNTKRQVAEDFVDRWSRQHGVWQDNGFRAMAVIGDEMQIETPQIGLEDGQFLNLSNYNDERIAALVGVPASVMGFYSKTRFDTIDSELEAYAENTILPELNYLSELFQTQVADRFFRTSAGTEKKALSELPHRTKRLVERAFDLNPESDTVVLVDPDSLPIMAKLNLSRIEQAGKIRDSLDLSANEAAEYVGIDLEPSEVRDQIWVPSTRQRIDHLGDETKQQVGALAEQVKALQKQLSQRDDDAGKSIKPVPAELKDAIKAFRSLVLDAVANGHNFDKRKALALFDSKEFEWQVHKAFLYVAGVLRSNADPLACAKGHLNDMARPANLRRLMGEK